MWYKTRKSAKQASSTCQYFRGGTARSYLLQTVYVLFYILFTI
jgi:hypothetical protein